MCVNYLYWMRHRVTWRCCRESVMWHNMGHWWKWSGVGRWLGAFTCGSRWVGEGRCESKWAREAEVSGWWRGLMRAADRGHVACVDGIRAVLREFEVSLRVSLRFMLGGCKRYGFISWLGGWWGRGGFGPWYGLRRDMWNTGWTLESGGRASS